MRQRRAKPRRGEYSLHQAFLRESGVTGFSGEVFSCEVTLKHRRFPVKARRGMAKNASNGDKGGGRYTASDCGQWATG